MKGKKVSVQSLWCSIKAAIACVGLRLRASKKVKDGDDQILAAFSIPVKAPLRKHVCLVKWNRLNRG